MSRRAIDQVLTEVHAAGVELRTDGARVRFHPAAAMSPGLLARVRDLPRPQLILELDARSDPLTAAVIDLFDGEIVPESEWGETVPFQAGGAS